MDTLRLIVHYLMTNRQKERERTQNCRHAFMSHLGRKEDGILSTNVLIAPRMKVNGSLKNIERTKRKGLGWEFQG